MKPELGNAATSAPKAASFQRMRRHRQVEQLRDRRGRAKAVQHARQREEQHKAVEPRYGLQRQHAPLRRQVSGQHECEKGEGDEQDGEHGAWDCVSNADGSLAAG
jgi:hypothetical protein